MGADAFSEDDLVDMILLAGILEFRKRNRPPVDTSVHWMKVAFESSRELDLNVTRSWYKFGEFVYTDRLKDQRIRNLYKVARPETFIGFSENVRKAVREQQSIFSKIQSSVRSKFDMFQIDSLSLRKLVYFKYAPPRYSGLYHASMDLVADCDKIVRNTGERAFFEGDYKRISARTSALHLNLVKSEIREDCADVVIEWTSLIELMALRRDLNTEASGSWMDGWMANFSRLIRQYQDEVWDFPSAQIAMDTIEGPRADIIKKTMLDKMDNSELYKAIEVHLVESELERQGFLPTEEELEHRIESIEKEHPDEAPIIREATLLYLKS